jgi:hypothetical protein
MKLEDLEKLIKEQQKIQLESDVVSRPKTSSGVGSKFGDKLVGFANMKSIVTGVQGTISVMSENTNTTPYLIYKPKIDERIYIYLDKMPIDVEKLIEENSSYSKQLQDVVLYIKKNHPNIMWFWKNGYRLEPSQVVTFANTLRPI